MLKEFGLQGKVAIVTGAGAGIGKGIVVALADAGADIVAADISESAANAAAEEIRKLGRKCLPVVADVSKADQVKKMVEQGIAEYGHIDILVNNAAVVRGVQPLVPLPHMGDKFRNVLREEDWRGSFDVDLHGTFLCTREVGPYFVKQKSGKVINITSYHAEHGFDYNAAYCAGKAAKARFTQCMAKEWARYNINVNAIGPGLTHTEMTDKYIFSNEKVRERTLAEIPLGRAGNTRDIGLLCVYLASEASSWITGQSIYIDGGQSIP
jgi:NAD(P)-dependent dehydrogenase (short-subunit alcohol dehydrogenase family)